MRKIGSNTPAVRQHYIAYRLFCQIQDAEVLPDEHVQNRFRVMYLSLRTPGVQKRLGLDMKADPEQVSVPIKPEKENVLPHFARWIYGDGVNLPLFTDSRQVDLFGRILESDDAFAYLCDNKDARFEHARVLAGGDLPETVLNIRKASEHIRPALSQAHRYRDKDDVKLQGAVDEFGTDALQLMSIFPPETREVRDLLPCPSRNRVHHESRFGKSVHFEPDRKVPEMTMQPEQVSLDNKFGDFRTDGGIAN